MLSLKTLFKRISFKVSLDEVFNWKAVTIIDNVYEWITEQVETIVAGYSGFVWNVLSGFQSSWNVAAHPSYKRLRKRRGALGRTVSLNWMTPILANSSSLTDRNRIMNMLPDVSYLRLHTHCIGWRSIQMAFKLVRTTTRKIMCWNVISFFQ